MLVGHGNVLGETAGLVIDIDRVDRRCAGDPASPAGFEAAGPQEKHVRVMARG